MGKENSTSGQGEVGHGSGGYQPLDPYDKLCIIGVGAFLVAFTLLIVVCTVVPGCWLHSVCCKDDKPRYRRRRHFTENGGSSRNGAAKRNEAVDTVGMKVLKHGNTYYYGATDIREKGACQAKRGEPRSSLSASSTTTTTTASSQLSDQNNTARFSSGNIKTRNDSSASSMSLGSAFSGLSLRSSSHDQSEASAATGGSSRVPLLFGGTRSSSGSGGGGAKPAPPPTPTVTFALQLDREEDDDSKGKLTISIEQAQDLPVRDYGAPCDPQIRASLQRDRRSLRSRSKVVAEFRTLVARHDCNPRFAQDFNTSVPLNEYKNYRLKFSALDVDRRSKTTEMGSCALMLKEVKHLGTVDEKITITQYINLKSHEFGEILFGMSYLPTAERLSFTITKASGLKYQEIVEDLEKFTPYVRVLQLNPSGRVVKKKKTSGRAGTKDPVFNETLIFELPTSLLDSVAFLVLVSHKEASMEMHDMESVSSPEPPTDRSSSGDQSSGRSQSSGYRGASRSLAVTSSSSSSSSSSSDLCLGRVCIGAGVRGDRERTHWAAVLQTPRKVCSQWHVLH